MHIVAIAALHQPFIHPMMERHVELGLLLEMTGVAKLGLGFYEQEFLGLRMVRRMTGNATHVILSMLRVDVVHVLRAARVARQAARVDLLGRMVLEDKNLCDIAPSGNMSGPGTMTSFASLVRWTSLGVERRLPMRRFLPVVVDILVAGLAGFRSDIVGSIRWRAGCFGLAWRRAGMNRI